MHYLMFVIRNVKYKVIPLVLEPLNITVLKLITILNKFYKFYISAGGIVNMEVFLKTSIPLCSTHTFL